MIRILVFAIICFSCSPQSQSQAIINEIMAHNEKGCLINGDTVFSDWIEIKNIGTEVLHLGGYYLTDNIKKEKKWRIPDSTFIGPGSFLILFADGKDSALHAGFGLSKNGEQLALFSPGLQLTDSLTFEEQRRDVSFGRKKSSNEKVYFNSPTPGKENSDVYFNTILPDPQLSLKPGFYSDPSEASITCTKEPGATIRYTLDGSEPTENSPEYQSMAPNDSLTVVRLRTFKEGSLPSNIVSGTYFIPDRKHKLPVVSLIAKPEDFFGDSTGIYVKGKNGAPGYCMGNIKRNYCQDWERSVHVEFFDKDGRLGFAQQMGVKIHGKCTRNFPQKSLAFFARGKYGKPDLDYRLFPAKSLNRFEAFLLRNSGNDFGKSMFRDALMSELVRDSLDVEVQAYQPVSAYLNGKYWGLYNLREKINEHFIASNRNVDPEKITMLEGLEKLIHGNSEEIKELYAMFKNKTLPLNDTYDFWKEKIDIASFTDYIIAEMYCANTDWPRNNVKFWKPENGKWRWILFDMDLGFGLQNESAGTDMIYYLQEINAGRTSNFTAWLFGELLKSEQYRNDFRKRYLYLLNTAFHPDRVIQKIDSIRNLIADEMPYQRARWGEYGNWEWEIEKLKKFARERPGYMKAHIIELF